MATRNCVIGLTKTQGSAESIVESLGALGFSNHDISVLFPDQQGRGVLTVEKHTKAGKGAAAGAGTGGLLAGALGLLAGVGTVAIPGAGVFIAAGPLLAALSAAAVGAAVGGVAGALVGFGIPEYEAKQYADKVRAGSILILVHTETDEDRDRAQQTLKDCGATDICVSKESVHK